MTTETKGSNLKEELKDVSSADMINMLMQETKPVTPATTPITTGETAPTDFTKPLDTPAEVKTEVAAEVKTEVAVEKKEEPKVEAVATEAKTDELAVEFTLPGDDKLSLEVTDDGWKPLAKDLGFEIEADDETEFKTKLDDHYKSKYEINLGKYKPETQVLLEFVEAGGTIDQLLEPLKPLLDLKNLSDTELIYKDLELRKYTPELIEKEITRLTEADELDLTAHKLRETVDTLINNEQQLLMKQKLDATIRHDAFKQHTVVEEAKAVKAALSETKEFMTIPVPQKVTEVITKNLESGKYASLIKDPKVIAKFIHFVELEQQAIQQIENRERLKYKADRHNLPPLSTAGGATAVAATQTGVKAEGNWGALDNFFNQNE